jgi:hypothetical protein
MADPVIQFQSAGIVDEQARAAFEAAQQALAFLGEAMRAAVEAARVFVKQLAEALRPLVEALTRWVNRHWRAIRAAIGPSYRPDTIARKKLRHYARVIGRLHRC